MIFKEKAASMNRRDTLAALVSLPSIAAYAQEAPIRGAGATFPAGIYSAWAENFAKQKNTSLIYEPVGSSEGVRRIVAQAVDFGASDNPLSQDELDSNGLMQFPTLVGGIAPVVNLPGMGPGAIKLSAAVLGGIFLGRIDRWNDPKIAVLNRGVNLPARAIVRIVRDDGSGTTAGFSRYLAKASGEWPVALTPGAKIEWPGSVIAAKGNGAVVDKLRATEGAIAYVSSNSVRVQKLAYTLLLNRAGQYVPPLEENLQAAVRASGMSSSVDAAVSLLDQPGATAWPLTEATYILMKKKPADGARAAKALAFFYWAFSQGDRMASDTGFVPLPLVVQTRVVAKFRGVTSPSGDPLPFLASNGHRIG